ncbi:MAG: GrpB family protein [Lewinellaceae bacterium]|nr:GrpB family protein [Lewinellaceae bacterium]
MATEKIEIAPYDPAWAVAFESERLQLAVHLEHFQARVEHIGSTAVEGLGAKPIIDILVGIEKEELFGSVVNPLLDCGYCYYSCYEKKMPERLFFARLTKLQRQVFEDPGQLPPRDQFPPTHHLHVVAYGSSSWKRHLAFRDYLRTHSMARDAYYRLKVKLAKGTWESGNDYADAKTGFIRGIERLIELTG